MTHHARSAGLVLAVATAATISAGCVATGTPASPTVTVTTTAEPSTDRPASPTVTVTTTAEPSAAGTSAGPHHAAARKFRMPEVTGVGYAEALSRLESRGVSAMNVKAHDAGERGRIVLWPSHWRVVAQHPKAGARVSRSAKIRLECVKYTD